jgi:hypothetical protein
VIKLNYAVWECDKSEHVLKVNAVEDTKTAEISAMVWRTKLWDMQLWHVVNMNESQASWYVVNMKLK